MPSEPPDHPSDPYWKLRPEPTPAAEDLCRCAPCTHLMLRDALGSNPLTCVDCLGEVPPERLGLDAQLAEDLASWRSVSSSLFRLWLDSGEYEPWAAERLADPKGEVNLRGRELVARLNRWIRAYYWWFRDCGSSDEAEAMQCPVCGLSIDCWPNRNFRVCHNCSVLI